MEIQTAKPKPVIPENLRAVLTECLAALDSCGVSYITGESGDEHEVDVYDQDQVSAARTKLRELLE